MLPFAARHCHCHHRLKAFPGTTTQQMMMSVRAGSDFFSPDRVLSVFKSNLKSKTPPAAATHMHLGPARKKRGTQKRAKNGAKNAISIHAHARRERVCPGRHRQAAKATRFVSLARAVRSDCRLYRPRALPPHQALIRLAPKLLWVLNFEAPFFFLWRLLCSFYR